MSDNGENNMNSDREIPVENDAVFAEGPDPAYERLRATDPAAGVEVDLAAVRGEVDRRVGAAQPPSTAGSLRWMRVAAAVAAVALVGAAGFVVGSRSQDNSASSVRTTTSVAVGPGVAGEAGGAAAPAIGLGAAPGAGDAASQTAAGREPAGAPVASAAGGRVASDSAIGYGGWWGRTVFSDGGVSTEGGTAEGWAYDPSQVVSRANAEAVAAALGVAGPATAQYGSWVVGPTDGTGPSVSLMGDGLGSVSFYDPSTNYPICANGDMIEGTGMPPADCAVTEGPPAIQSEQAIAKAREVLASLGQNPDAFEYESQDDQKMGAYGYSNAYQVLDGQRTGQAWSFSFVGDKLSSFYGQLAPLVSVGQYNVVSPAEAVQRLNDPRFGSTGAVYPVDYVWPQAAGEAAATADAEPTDVTVPPAAAAGGAISWPVTEVTITRAQLGVAIQWQANGAALLVPAYSLTADDSVSWSVIAVADSELDFTSTP